MRARFIQIHTLTSYAASLLNRDDAGFAKRMPFGNATRTRVSSQCLKRHWRVYDGDNSLKSIAAPDSIRSRISFERFIVDPLIAEGVAEEAARGAANKIIGIIFGGDAKQEKAAKKGAKSSSDGHRGENTVAVTPQMTVLGRVELDYLLGIARQAIVQAGGAAAKVPDAVAAALGDSKALKENIRALAPGSLEAGLGAALFGRMVTGDVLARTDAAIHVAHAMTVHGQMAESDYFTAIDDLIREDGEQGAGLINASELTSGLFYGYVVVDVEGLVGNLGGDRELAGDVVQKLVHIVATVSPGAKKGSTAPYAYSHLVLAEAGTAQPRTLQNAFIEAVPTRGHVIENAYDAMREHLDDLDRMYGKREARAHAGMRTGGRFEAEMSLDELATWVGARVTT